MLIPELYNSCVEGREMHHGRVKIYSSSSHGIWSTVHLNGIVAMVCGNKKPNLEGSKYSI